MFGWKIAMITDSEASALRRGATHCSEPKAICRKTVGVSPFRWWIAPRRPLPLSRELEIRYVLKLRSLPVLVEVSSLCGRLMVCRLVVRHYARDHGK